MVAGATASTRQKLSVLTSSSSDTSDNNGAGGLRTTDLPSQNGANTIKEAGNFIVCKYSLKYRHDVLHTWGKGKK